MARDAAGTVARPRPQSNRAPAAASRSVLVVLGDVALGQVVQRVRLHAQVL